MGLSGTFHHSQTYFGSLTFTGRNSFGTSGSGSGHVFTYLGLLTQGNWTVGYAGTPAANISPTGPLPGRVIGSRTAANLISAYLNGAAAGSNSTPTTITPTTDEIWVFRSTNAGSGGQSAGIGMRHYSFGDSLNATQAAAFDAALAGFFTAMGRV
jgi:hypothetical protein